MRLVYIAPVPWGSFSQRPHRFVEWFRAKFRAEVLWVNPYPTRLARASDAWRLLNPQREQLRTPTPWLTEMHTPALPVEPLPGVRRCNRLLWRRALSTLTEFANADDCCICIGKPSLFAIEALKAVPFAASLYDMMDDFPAFYDGISHDQVRRSEREIIRIATHVCYSSAALRERCETIRQDAMFVPNGLDAETDWLERRGRAPGAAPVFGYLGTMASWFDWRWVAQLAHSIPKAQLRLYGPQFAEPTVDLPPNVSLHGPVQHAQAVTLMREFDVGLIPFRINALTEAVDPIKYYEYRALGMGILSTAFGEMASRGGAKGVFLTPPEGGDFSAQACAALAFSETHRVPSAAEASDFVSQHRWDKRFDGLELERRLPQAWPAAA
jgi:hypothetical protein